MKIALINTYDVQGGAARAAYRLNKGLRQINQDTKLISRYKNSLDPDVVKVKLNCLSKSDEIKVNLFEQIQQTHIDSKRSSLTNTYFSLPYPGFDLSNLQSIHESDVINLHWVARFQSPAVVHRLLKLGKPVVWTLHDMWAFTGGCHFSAGCLKYQQTCASCPQLLGDSKQLPEMILRDKAHYFQDKNLNLSIVSPSQWMADCARESLLFKDCRIEVIPNSVETDIFVSSSKKEAKKSIGTDEDVITILLGAMTFSEKRKGFSELTRILDFCLKKPLFNHLINHKKIELICVGKHSELLNSFHIPIRSLGYITSDDKMAQIYSAADIFLLTSLEDNLPNTMLEAMSCSTPVIAFNVGGIPDVVKENETGKLIQLGDLEGFAEALVECLANIDHCRTMGKRCRSTIEDGYTLNIQAQNYLNLFEELVRSSSSSLFRAGLAMPNCKTQSAADALVPVSCSSSKELDSFLKDIMMDELAINLRDTQDRVKKIEETLNKHQNNSEPIEDYLNGYGLNKKDLDDFFQSGRAELLFDSQGVLAEKDAQISTLRNKAKKYQKNVRKKRNLIKRLKEQKKLLEQKLKEKEIEIEKKQELVDQMDSNFMEKIQSRLRAATKMLTFRK